MSAPTSAPLAAPAAAPHTTAAARHALITGAGRGIGEAIARALAADGWTLSLAGRQAEPLQRLAEALNAEHPVAAVGTGPGAETPAHGAVRMDVTDAGSVDQAVAEARRLRGPIRALVNNAGAVDTAPFARTSPELWQRMLAVNLTGPFLCCQAVLPDLRQAQAGRIVNIASTAALKGYAYVSAYTAAKHGLLGLTRSLALELAAEGITVNAVCPGYTETDILREGVQRIVTRTGRDEAAARAGFERHNPQGRLVQPADVAAMVAWLCSDAAAAVNGQALAVDGGETM